MGGSDSVKGVLFGINGRLQAELSTQEAAIEKQTPEQQLKSMRSAIYGLDYTAYAKFCMTGGLKGI